MKWKPFNDQCVDESEKKIFNFDLFLWIYKSGPAQYDSAEHTTFTNTYKPISNKGYVLGARTGQREYYQLNVWEILIF